MQKGTQQLLEQQYPWRWCALCGIIIRSFSCQDAAVAFRHLLRKMSLNSVSDRPSISCLSCCIAQRFSIAVLSAPVIVHLLITSLPKYVYLASATGPLLNSFLSTCSTKAGIANVTWAGSSGSWSWSRFYFRIFSILYVCLWTHGVQLTSFPPACVVLVLHWSSSVSVLFMLSVSDHNHIRLQLLLLWTAPPEPSLLPAPDLFVWAYGKQKIRNFY